MAAAQVTALKQLKITPTIEAAAHAVGLAFDMPKKEILNFRSNIMKKEKPIQLLYGDLVKQFRGEITEPRSPEESFVPSARAFARFG